MEPILLCSDLDRTLLPNGRQPASEKAYRLLHRLRRRPEFLLAYVSGRDKTLLQRAIADYDIPLPDYAIGDVGTTIYEPGKNWQCREDWGLETAGDWAGHTRQSLESLLTDITSLRLQEPDKQNTLKLSYYTQPDIDRLRLERQLEARLDEQGVQASIIFSIDEKRNLGLLDILPRRATKVHAIRFIMKIEGIAESRTVFAGDSGNDVAALTSGLNGILVKNAHDDVKEEVCRTIRAKGLEDRFYAARGDFLGMNGNYCAGVLEGLAHFLPETIDWMTATSS